MKSKEEIKKLLDKINDIDSDDEIGVFIDLNDKGGHWIDALSWVLEEKAEEE